MLEKTANMKDAANLKVIEKDGQWYVQAKDNFFKVDAELALPKNFKLLDTEKQNYWLRRRITELATDIKQKIREKQNAIKNLKNV